MPWDSPADMMAARALDPLAAVDPLVAGLLVGEADLADLVLDDQEAEQEKPADEPVRLPREPSEPVHEYAALLEGLDPQKSVPYRPWDNFEVGQCILHLAWEDCGVVVAKERLPGGRQVIKCYFSEAGVVRLIENAPQ
jgi:hypothetical protein